MSRLSLSLHLILLLKFKSGTFCESLKVSLWELWVRCLTQEHNIITTVEYPHTATMLIWPLCYCGHFILTKTNVQSVIFLFVKEPLSYGLVINTDNFLWPVGDWIKRVQSGRCLTKVVTTRIWHLKPLMAAPFGWTMIPHRRLACEQTPTRKVWPRLEGPSRN